MQRVRGAWLPHRHCLFFHHFRSERAKHNFQLGLFLCASQRKECENNNESTERGGETDRDRVAFLSGPCGGCWSPKSTNQSAAVRSSACGSLAFNRPTEVELNNGYWNPQSEWKSTEIFFVGGLWSLLVLLSLQCLKFYYEVPNELSKDYQACYCLICSGTQFFVVLVYMW